MIVVGVDPHKKTHTGVAVESAVGRYLDALTIQANRAGYEKLLTWARRISPERTWAIEDCRHTCGPFVRFLIVRGEKVVWVAPKLMAKSRRSARTHGKSDDIDARNVALAAIREKGLPEAKLEGPELDVRLLLDHREDLVTERTRLQQRLRWHLHDLEVELEIPAGGLDRKVWIDRLRGVLDQLDSSIRSELCLELTERCVELNERIRELEKRIVGLVKSLAPQLLDLPGCSALTAAKLIGEIAGVNRFSSDSKLALHAGVAPLEASSGNRVRHRLNRKGNRQLNLALHRIAVTQGRIHPPAMEYLARKQREGKSRREALRCLKRHLVRRIFKLLSENELRKEVDLATVKAAGLT